MQHHYELMFIVPGAVDENQVPTVKERVTSLVTANGATITYEEDMGRRRLAYQIEHQTHGHYFVMEFDVEGSALKELDRKLTLDTEVLRHLIVSAVVKTPEQMKRAAERRQLAEVERAKKQAAREAKEQPKPVAVAAAVVPTEEVDLDTDDLHTSTAKVSIEELDKKLDAILDDSDLEGKL